MLGLSGGGKIALRVGGGSRPVYWTNWTLGQSASRESYEARNEVNSSQYDREFEFESYEDWVEAMNYGLSSEEYYAWYDSTNQWAEGDDHWVEGNGY